MFIISKVDTETVEMYADVPELNALIAQASLIPIIKNKNPYVVYGQYKMKGVILNSGFDAFLKRIIFGKPNHIFEMQHHERYEGTSYIDELKPAVIFFDGSYMSLTALKEAKKRDVFTYTIAYNRGDANRIKDIANDMEISLDGIYIIDYKHYFDAVGKYIVGRNWLASTIGASMSNTVMIPSTEEFWSTERTKNFYIEGSTWLSRYYGRNVQLLNPNTLSKKDILNKIKTEDFEILSPCKCGECMECYTTFLIKKKELKPDFFSSDPRLYSAGKQMIKSAISNKIPSSKIYSEFI
jgi:hypothetical protein